MRILLIVVALMLCIFTSCNEEEEIDYSGRCDYCAQERPTVFPYKCQQCESMHRSCRRESLLRERGWSYVELKVCPVTPNGNAE